MKAVLFQLVTSINVERTSHDPLQRQCFEDYLDSAMDIPSTSKKDHAFFTVKSSLYAI